MTRGRGALCLQGAAMLAQDEMDRRSQRVVVAQIRSRSNLSDEAAVAVARSALRDVRRETTG